ncbi:MAG: aminomethyl transferase family protein [Acidobacteria bacterium]|nr:aminomethyl transferase family protein [Acidobacteriota bacterium]
MTQPNLRELYEKANQYRKTPFLERPYLGSPGAPAQAETNVSNLWAHLNGGFLFAYEYTRWWHECRALRNTAILGDWSWLNKVRVRGPDASRFLNYATAKDLSQQQIGQVMYTPMVDDKGKIAIEGLTFKFAEDDFMFTQSGAQMWLRYLRDQTHMNVELEDVTPDYTCYALQGPRSLAILEAVTGESFQDLRFSRWRKARILGDVVIIDRQGVTGEIGYEFVMPTTSGKAHELWRLIRDVGRDFGLRELGFKAQMVGHTETGIATAVRDYLPARMAPAALPKFARLWTTEEELKALHYDLTEHWCSPAELGWAHTVNLDNHDFHGRAALVEEANRGGPERRFVGLLWNSDDMAALYAALFRDEPSPPPLDLPYGQFRMLFLKLMKEEEIVGWASGVAYSPNLRRVISLGRIRKDLAGLDTEVSVLWGGFSNEPKCAIRAQVSKLPFIQQHRRSDLAAT